MPRHQGITYSEAARQIIAELDGPISMDEFVQRVLAIKPSRAKNPRQAILDAIWKDLGDLFVRPDPHTLVPLHRAMKGIRFRWVLSRPEVEHGRLLVTPVFLGYGPRHPHVEEWLQLEDAHGRTIPVKETSVVVPARDFIGKDIEPYMGDYFDTLADFKLPAIDLASWMQDQHAEEGGSILFTVMAWEKKKRVLRLAYESPTAWESYRDHIVEQDELVEATLFDILERERDETIWVQHAIPSMHVLMDGPRDLPGSHWTAAIIAKGRMRFDEIFITYIDSRRGLWGLSGRSPIIQPEKGTDERKQKVFRFKVFYPYRKSSWREIEVLGSQTMHDLDRAIRKAFGHDTSDHLSGFWKLIRRGDTNRFREVSIGTVYLFWPDEEAINDVLVAELDLEEGDRMKYVYDFGDWIEHRMELEAIESPRPKASYPRILRKPRKTTRKKPSKKAK